MSAVNFDKPINGETDDIALALQCAAMAVSGNPHGLNARYSLRVADAFLEWLRAQRGAK